MDNIARAISGAALLWAGVALVLFNRFSGEPGLFILVCGFVLGLIGFYVSWRATGLSLTAKFQSLDQWLHGEGGDPF
jgi:hypothetical protein